MLLLFNQFTYSIGKESDDTATKATAQNPVLRHPVLQRLTEALEARRAETGEIATTETTNTKVIETETAIETETETEVAIEETTKRGTVDKNHAGDIVLHHVILAQGIIGRDFGSLSRRSKCEMCLF